MTGVAKYNGMMSHLTRPPAPKTQVANLVDEMSPGPLKDELQDKFDPDQETYEEYLQRRSLGERPFNAANGGSPKEEIVEPPKSMQVDTTTKGIGDPLEDFKKKADIFLQGSFGSTNKDFFNNLIEQEYQKALDAGVRPQEALSFLQERSQMYRTLADEGRRQGEPATLGPSYGRENKAIGGGAFVGEELPNNREGFSELYGPNIRKMTTSDSFEVIVNRGGKRYYGTFSYGDGSVQGPKPKYSTKEEALEAANKFRDSVKNLPKATGKESKGRPVGTKLEKGKAAEIRKILNQFIAEGKTSFSTEDVSQLVDSDLFDTDKSIGITLDSVKKEPEFKDLNFIDARSQKSKADYYYDPDIRKKIKENYGKLKQESLAKLIFPNEPFSASKSRLASILSDMAAKGEIDRLKQGEASEERIQDFDPSPQSEKRKKIDKRRRKKIDVLGSKDYEDELYKFKKEVQAGLGLEKVKKGRTDPIDMGHQSSITQLKALKQKLRPEDLSPQFYKANQLGIQKYEGGVKTLESALNRKYYPEQKKLYNQAKKFINAGKAVPEDLQNKIIKSNEDIQKFIDKTVKEYPLLKDRVNAITIDPINLNVKRGDNIFRQLGVGLVDKNLGDIEIGSLDDLTIKANLAEQTLREAINAGLIDKEVGRQKLDTFLQAQPIELEEISNVQKVLRKMGGQLNSGMDPKLLVEYLGAEMKDIAAFGQKYGGDVLGKVGRVTTGIDLPIFQTLFASTYDIEQDSPVWLTLPAAFTDEVANIFKLYDKSEGRFGLGKVKDFGKFVASSFVPKVVRSPLFKGISKVGKATSLAAPLTETAVGAYRFKKMKDARDDAIRQFNIPIEIANKGFDDYIRSTIPQDAFDELNVPASPGLPKFKRGLQELASMVKLADNPYEIQKVRGDVTGTGLTSPMALQRLYDRQGLDEGGPPDPKRRMILKMLGLIPAGIAGLASLRFGPKKVKKIIDTIKTTKLPGKPEWFDTLVNKVIREGTDMTKQFATKDREIVHATKISDDEYVRVHQDLETGSIRVDYDSPFNMGEETVSLEFRPGIADETTGGKKPRDEFQATEVEPRYVGGPEDADMEFDGIGGGSSIKMLESDVSNLERYATGKGPTMKEFVESKKRKDRVRAINEDQLEAAEYISGKYGDGPEPDYDDFID